MSNYSEEDGFAAALHQAAGILPAPSPQALYDGSLRRGRTIRRRRWAGAGLTAGLAVCALATLAVTLPGGGQGGSSSNALSVSASAAASAASDPATPPASTGLPATGPVSSAQMLQTFTGMLPASAVPFPAGGLGAPSATNPARDVASGLWNAQVALTLQSQNPGGDGDSYVVFILYDGAWARSCTQAADRAGRPGACATTSLDGGKLFTITDPGDYATNPSVCYVWLSASGYTTELTITDTSVSDFQLTTAQIKGVITGAAWSALAGRLAD